MVRSAAIALAATFFNRAQTAPCEIRPCTLESVPLPHAIERPNGLKVCCSRCFHQQYPFASFRQDLLNVPQQSLAAALLLVLGMHGDGRI
jgi:hypothetical protein